MIIGNDFSKKYEALLKQVGALSEEDISHHISVKKLCEVTQLDRTEIKNVIEYLDELNFIDIQTIGGPLLYGHITITEEGLEKYYQLKNNA
ncbi:hypothetical protein [Fodinibius sp. Rm-B-1B1-1]|uniref:hypothetical protein n=1 Tax=Fodinibius alkaliphilus TaxID=3140241 RepID=UPI00315B304D